jgi:peptidoglycan/LPS O-acetylase OafA/YrhL
MVGPRDGGLGGIMFNGPGALIAAPIYDLPALAIAEGAAALLLLSARAPTNGGAQKPAVHGARITSLDGLRGIACLLIVFMHTAAIPTAGFLGVSLFFVLSGYLISSLLLEEQTATGTIRIGRFYALRCVRLLPPFAVAYVLCCIMASRWPEIFPAIALQDLPEILFATNFHLGEGRNPFPQLSHAWSLSAEWQFYFAWPFILLLLGKVGIGRRGLIVACLIGIMASWAWRILTGMDLRGLMLGVLIAVIARDHRFGQMATSKPALIAAPLALTLFILLSFTQAATPDMMNIGVDIAIALGGAMVFFCSKMEHPWLSPVLSHPVLRYFGRISYGLYLYHFPLAWMMFTQGYTPVQIALVVIPLSIIIADFSWRFLEAPLLAIAKEYWAARRVLVPGFRVAPEYLCSPVPSTVIGRPRSPGSAQADEWPAA